MLNSVPLHQGIICFPVLEVLSKCFPQKGNNFLSLPCHFPFTEREMTNPDEDGIADTKGELCGASFKMLITSIKPEEKRKVGVTDLASAVALTSL